MINENTNCEDCGGNEFYKESGYFYCKECQTQSQKDRDHVFQDERSNIGPIITKKVRSEKNKKQIKLTSWECYNIVICSLTQELINLGASKELKPIVKCLWLKYLEKLEVLNVHFDIKPKLQLINHKRDLRILDTAMKNGKRTKYSSDELSKYTCPIKRQRTKNKTALAKVDYEEMSQMPLQDNLSLQNISLSNLKSSDQLVLDNSLQFSSYSLKELKDAGPSKYHIKKHKQDVLLNLKCHVGYQHVTSAYSQSVHYLSPVKVYCIMYLGLLINKDKIQLSDLFRFMREGHLSFNKYTDLLPETYLSTQMNIHNNNKNNLFACKKFREKTAKMAQFLNVTKYIVVPNLVELSQRYCQEMNLPDAVFQAVENLISKTKPKLGFTDQCKIIPNYEGRVMCIILFILKLLFGLDGVTEFHLSDYALSINRIINNPQMFNINIWLQYIGYRQLLMNRYHLPSAQLSNAEVNSDVFLQYLGSPGCQLENEDRHISQQINGYTKLLTILASLQSDSDGDMTKVTFSPSLTPFLRYSEELHKSSVISPQYLKDILKYDFRKHSMDFLLYPNLYFELFGSKVTVKNGGANDNWLMEHYKNKSNLTNSEHKNINIVPVEITRFGCDSNVGEIFWKPEINSKHKYNCNYAQKHYYNCRRQNFIYNSEYLKKKCKQANITNNLFSSSSLGCYSIHYNPYERYWFYFVNMKMTKIDIDSFIHRHTNSFQLIFQEFSRLVEQNYKDLIDEFHSTELFLVFSVKYDKKNDETFKSKTYLNNDINYYVNRAEILW